MKHQSRSAFRSHSPTSSATCPFSSSDRLKTYSGLLHFIVYRLFLYTANLFLDTLRMASKMILLRLSWNKLCFENSFKMTPKATASAISLLVGQFGSLAR